jgi:integrase
MTKKQDDEKPTRNAKGEGSITKRPDGTYRGYVPVNGKRKTFSAPTKALAQQKRRELLNARDTGELATGKAPLLADWLEHWLTISNHKRSTTNGYRQTIRKNIVPALGKVRLNMLTMEQVEQLYADMADRGLKGSTIHQAHSVLRAALKQAVWRGHATRNVAALVKPPSVGRVKMGVFSSADSDAILAAAVGTRYEARWHLALVLGLRPGEATGIEWTHIDFSAGTLVLKQQLQALPGQGTIIVSSTKSDAGERTIVLPPYLVEMFIDVRMRQMQEMAELGAAWKGWEFDGVPRALVFTQRNGAPLRPTLDVTEWRKVLDIAGLPHVRRYTARHTAASLMIDGGMPLPTVSHTLGHANTSFTINTYVKPLDESKKKMASHFEEAQARRVRLAQVQKLGLPGA